jgi:hypothetical protein
MDDYATAALDPSRLNELIGAAFSGSLEQRDLLTFLAEFAKQPTSIDVLFDAPLESSASEATIVYCMQSLNTILSSPGSLGAVPTSRLRHFFTQIIPSMHLTAPILNATSNLFVTLFHDDLQVACQLLNSLTREDRSHLLLAATFAARLTTQTNSISCCEPFLSMTLSPFVSTPPVPSDILAAAQILNNLVASFQKDLFPPTIVDIIRTVGVEHLFDASRHIETPELLCVIRTIVELPLAAFRREPIHRAFVQNTVIGFVAFANSETITPIQASELSVLCLALRNTRFLRCVPFNVCFRSFWVEFDCQSAGLSVQKC